MADVRASAGVPAAAAFGGVATATPSTPLVVDTTNVALYALIGGTVVKLASGVIRSGSGVPAIGDGANGDFYFRTDGAAGTFIYHKAGGAWTAFV